MLDRSASRSRDRDRKAVDGAKNASASSTGWRRAIAGSALATLRRSDPAKVPKAAGHLPGKRFGRDRYASIATKFRSGVKRRDVPSQADIGT